MGFLKSFFKNVLKDEQPGFGTSSFESLSEEELETHLCVSQYGNFELTNAVRPSYDLQVIPRQGFRHETYNDDDTNANLPVLMAAATRESLFETFMELLEPLGNVVDVVLESSHVERGTNHKDLYREHIDMPVFKSILWDFEDLLTHDGCTGIAVLNPHGPNEVQLDEHKLLIVYGDTQGEFEEILQGHRIMHDDEIRFITEAEHVHSSSDVYMDRFHNLATTLGMDCDYY